MTRSGRPGLRPQKLRPGRLFLMRGSPPRAFSISVRCRRCCGRPSSTDTSRLARGWFRSRAGRCRCSTKASSPSTLRFGTAAASSTSRTWASSKSRARSARGVPAVGPLERPRPDRPRPGAVHAADQRAGWDRRRPDRLRARRRALSADRQRVEPRARLRLAARARAARRRAARRLGRRTRCSRCRGRARSERARGLPDAAAAFTFADGEIDDVGCTVNRTGYTGEHGVELLVPAERAPASCGTRVIDRGAAPCGLGARDTLRLEVCYPLHGNDIGTRPTRSPPASAGSVRSTRTSPASPSCGASRRRARRGGLPRSSWTIPASRGRGCRSWSGGEAVGGVTSGSHSPMLERGIGLGYVDAGLAQPGRS